MEALAFLAIGIIGGSLVALVTTRLRIQLPDTTGADQFARRPLSTDVINMASIRVAGVGGLGLVAVSVAVALTIPSIGVSVGMGLVTGVILALILIYRRRRTGPLPSSGKGIGANTVLAIDDGRAQGEQATDGHPKGLRFQRGPEGPRLRLTPLL